MNEEKSILKYPDGPKEVIKHMDFMPGNEKEKLDFLMNFIQIAATN